MARTRRPFICGNWKLNGSIADSLALATEVKNAVATVREVEVAVAPSFTALHAVAKRLEGTAPSRVAAQDCFWEDKGAFTGEVAPAARGRRLQPTSSSATPSGASIFGELDAAVNLKARAALRAGLVPIVCIGETLNERDAGETFGRLIRPSSTARCSSCSTARRRAWSSPTNRSGRSAPAAPPRRRRPQEVHHFIRARSHASARAAAEAAHPVRWLRQARQRRALMAEADVDGGLVGGASLAAAIIRSSSEEGSGA